MCAVALSVAAWYGGLLFCKNTMLMSRMIRSLVAAAMAGLLCMGCASDRSAMVCFAPDDPSDARTPQQMLSDFNKAMPFEIKPGDFVGGRTIDGPNCWVCLGDRDKTVELMAVIDSTPGWRFRSIGFVNNQSRHVFGLSPQPVSLQSL